MNRNDKKILDSVIIIRKLSNRITSDIINREFSRFGKIEMIELNLNKRIAFIVIKLFIKNLEV